MGRLIRMDFYRLIQSKVFWISLLIFSGLQFILNFFNGMFANYNAETIADAAHKSYEWHTFNSPITEVIETPILSLFIIVLFISIVSFCHADQANGYIKNIAGQVGDRGKIVFSKFIIIGLHNLIFFAAGALSNVLGSLIAGVLVNEGNVFLAILTLLIKWLLSMAVSSILLFFTVGIRNKSLGIITAVVFGANVFSLMYMGLGMAVENIFHVSVNIGDFMPDSLMGAVSVGNNELVVNGLVVSAVFIAAFLILTYIVFKKRDVK